jgi:hypothetical protein
MLAPPEVTISELTEGAVPNTSAPLPVSSVTAAIMLALVGVDSIVATPVPNPVTPVETGKPVALVSVADDGVPKAGVTKTGELLRTTLPDPVELVTPVPPFATPNVPSSVTAPLVAVAGVKPVVPPEKVDTADTDTVVQVRVATSPLMPLTPSTWLAVGTDEGSVRV